MNTTNTICIDSAKFKKASKKLLSKLNDNFSLDLKLNQTQEILAQVLGFRNLFELQQTISPGIDINSNISKPFIFRELELDQAVQVIHNLMDGNGNDMWRTRAMTLINAVLKVLLYLQSKKEISIDSDTIRNYLYFDNLVSIYQTRKDFPEDISSTLYSYLSSLPGFKLDHPKQNNVVLEQHGYLQMQFSSVLSTLQKIEQNNFIIADLNWFTEINTDLMVAPVIQELDFLEDSWLAMDECSKWINTLHSKKQLKSIYVSDLLVYVTTIISPNKRNSMNLILQSILDNYSTASNMSKQIQSRIK